MFFCEIKYYVRFLICILNNIVKKENYYGVVCKKNFLMLYDGID